MEKRLSIYAAMFIAVGLTTSVTANHAAVVSIDSLTVSWLSQVQAITPAISKNGTSSASFYWGVPTSKDGQSGYNFTTASTPISHEVPPQTPVFTIGT